MIIKELRIKKGLTQKEAATLVGLSLRTYQNYEYEKSTRDKFKINQIISLLNQYQRITIDKGIYTIEEIKDKVTQIAKERELSFVYLFGSYAKGTMNEKSDIDLLVSNEIKGLEFLGLVDELAQNLNKRVDVVRIDDLKNNFEFLNEILATGVKIYRK